MDTFYGMRLIAPLAVGVTCALLVVGTWSGAASANSCLMPYGVRIGPGFDRRQITTLLPGHPVLALRAGCRSGPSGGWSLGAVEDGHAYRSARFGYGDPITIIAVYNYAKGKLPAILVALGSPGMTSQAYQLWTFKGRRIVPATMRFTHSWPGSELEGGVAVERGHGVFCSQASGKLVVTQVDWSGPRPGAPIRNEPNGAVIPAPSDKVVAEYARWTLEGQPLHQVAFKILASKTLRYGTASRLVNVHCQSRRRRRSH